MFHEWHAPVLVDRLSFVTIPEDAQERALANVELEALASGEELLLSSWHHRALLGDEGRTPYVSARDMECVNLASDDFVQDDDVDNPV